MHNLISSFIGKIHGEILFSKGQNYARKSDTENAIIYYDKALVINPKYSGIYLHKALSQSLSGKYDDAIRNLLTAIELNPLNVVYHLFLARIHLDYQRFNSVYLSLNESSKLDKSNPLNDYLRGITLLFEGNITEGYNYLINNVNQLNDDCKGRILLFYEEYLMRDSQIIESITKQIENYELIKENLSIDINCLYLIYNFFFENKVIPSYQQLDNKKIFYFYRLIEVFPELNEARKKLISMYLAEELCQGIISKENKDLSLTPIDNIFFTVLLITLGREEKAEQYFNQAAIKDPQNEIVKYLQGQFHLYSNKRIDAISDFVKASHNLRFPEYIKLILNRLNNMKSIETNRM